MCALVELKGAHAPNPADTLHLKRTSAKSSETAAEIAAVKTRDKTKLYRIKEKGKHYENGN